MEGDLRARVVAVEHKLNDQKSRIVAMEKWQQEQNIANAVRDERWTTTLTRLNNIDGNLKWIVRLVIGGIIAALVAFMVGGGLTIPR
jgi:cell division protein FtsX